MTLNAQFVINKNLTITVATCTTHDTINGHALPEENTVTPLDTTIVTYCGINYNLILKKDELQEILLPFYTVIKKNISSSASLLSNLSPGQLGYTLNRFYNEDITYDTHNLYNSIIWCGNHTMTALYQYNNTTYLEIAPIYPWHFKEPHNDDQEFISFSHFIHIYEPYLVKSIPQETIITWHKQCRAILEQIGAM